MNGFASQNRSMDEFKAMPLASKPIGSLGIAPALLLTWESKIRKCLVRGNSATLDLARILSAARRALHFGEWSQLWASARRPFSKRKAEMLVVVGRELGEIGAQNSAHLPWRWNILYYLARLGRSLVERLIVEQTIHPALTLTEAKALLARFKGQPERAGRRSSVLQRLRRFSEFVRQTSPEWTAAQRDVVQTALLQLVDELHNGAAASTSAPPLTRPSASNDVRYSQN